MFVCVLGLSCFPHSLSFSLPLFLPRRTVPSSQALGIELIGGNYLAGVLILPIICQPCHGSHRQCLALVLVTWIRPGSQSAPIRQFIVKGGLSRRVIGFRQASECNIRKSNNKRGSKVYSTFGQPISLGPILFLPASLLLIVDNSISCSQPIWFWCKRIWTKCDKNKSKNKSQVG